MEGKEIPAKGGFKKARISEPLFAKGEEERCKGPDGQGGSREGKGKEESSKGPDGQGGSREGKGGSAASGGRKCLYMFIWNVQDCPNIYTLFAVDIPDEDSSFPNPPLLVDGLVMKPNEIAVPPKLPLTPILEFPRTRYPMDMCCVELDSELYFFGGFGGRKTFREDEDFPTDVYIFKPLKMKIIMMIMKMMETMEMTKLESKLETKLETKWETKLETKWETKWETKLELMQTMETMRRMIVRMERKTMVMEMMDMMETIDMMQRMDMVEMKEMMEMMKMMEMMEMKMEEDYLKLAGMKIEEDYSMMMMRMRMRIRIMKIKMKMKKKMQMQMQMQMKRGVLWEMDTEMKMKMQMQMHMQMKTGVLWETDTEMETKMEKIKEDYLTMMKRIKEEPFFFGEELQRQEEELQRREEELQRREGALSFLERGPHMNTGKSGALPFVFDRKIYVITTSSNFHAPKQSRFEFFDPDAGDGYGKWTRLEDPPERGFIYGYTVIDRKAIFLTRNSGIFSFNLDSHKWLKVSQFRPPFVIDSGVFVDDTFFTCSDSFVITSFPPLSSSSSSASGANGSKQKDETEKLLEFFNYTNMITLAPGVINTQLQAVNSRSSFLHMKGKGNGRRFCHVLLGSPSPDCPEIEFSSYATITIFDALKDTFVSETCTFLKAKLLYSESFPLQAYVQPNDAGAFYLINASILPACRAHQIV